MRPSDRAKRLATLEARASISIGPIRPRLPRNHPTARFFLRDFTEAEIDQLAEAQQLAEAGIPYAAWPAPLQLAAGWLVACTHAHLRDVQQLLAAGQLELTEPPLLLRIFALDYAHADLVDWFDHWMVGICAVTKLPWPSSLAQLAAYVEGALGDTATIAEA